MRYVHQALTEPLNSIWCLAEKVSESTMRHVEPGFWDCAHFGKKNIQTFSATLVQLAKQPAPLDPSTSLPAVLFERARNLIWHYPRANIYFQMFCQKHDDTGGWRPG